MKKIIPFVFFLALMILSSFLYFRVFNIPPDLEVKGTQEIIFNIISLITAIVSLIAAIISLVVALKGNK